MKHAAHLQLVDEYEQGRLAEEAKMRRGRRPTRRRIYIVGAIAVATMIALFARAFMQPPVRF